MHIIRHSYMWENYIRYFNFHLTIFERPPNGINFADKEIGCTQLHVRRTDHLVI